MSPVPPTESDPAGGQARQPGAFGGAQLMNSLARLPRAEKFWIGFSGGADSTALLQAMHDVREQLQAPLHALHFHHGLQSDADAWQVHCRSFCEARGIPFRSERLDIDRSGGTSLEEESRNCRYRTVARILGKDEMYLTAHHAEDLAETLFLNLMRGSGIEGLAGIPVLRELGRGWVARPLLDTHRGDLIRYLESRGIGWLTDPSNADTRFDRNYLRQALFPVLETRWPGLVARLARTARNARNSANALALFIDNQAGHLIRDELKLPLDKLLGLDPELRPLVLRQWLRRHEVPVLPESRLREFLKQLAEAGPESRAEVQWEHWMIKRYRSDLWLHGREPLPACPEMDWKQGMELRLGPGTGQLSLQGRPAPIPSGWRVRARRPGDRFRPQRNGSSRKIKHLFQAATVPPWLRPGIPLLEWDGEPVALGDWLLAPRLQDWLHNNGLDYRWQPDDPVLDRLRRDSQSCND